MAVVIEPVDAVELRRALAPFRSRLREVRVFGSRATGRARRTSDLDLVVYGADPDTLDALTKALEASLLPMTVDVLAYETITSDLLRRHIDRVAKPLELEDAK
jgi:predicted nucleotidyltransferase